MPKRQQTPNAQRLAAIVDEALGLLEHSRVPSTTDFASGTPATLLEQCRELCAEYEAKSEEPVRIIHHLACTGGTLITKCLCAMPNTQVLSEVDPLSPLPTKSSKPSFAPSDMITLVRQSHKQIDQNLIIDLFTSNLAIIRKKAAESGQRLILRDHAHSHFHTGDSIPVRPDLRSIVNQEFPALSAVTVRHPLDSYLSLKHNNWLHFSPPTLEEYCRRYLVFLDTYEDVSVFKYEDFTKEPKMVMCNLCKALELPYSDDFVDLFSVFRLAGDSGRKGEVIDSRPPRPLDRGTLEASQNSASYKILLEWLGYNFRT